MTMWWEILKVIVWCFAVYVCSYDWEPGKVETSFRKHGWKCIYKDK